jgi:glucokinase
LSYLAVDIGATNVRVAVGHEDGLGPTLGEQTDRLHGPGGVAAQIVRMARRLGAEPDSVGVGSIGPLDLRRGRITNTPNYPFKDIPVAEPLLGEFGVPVWLMNDCNAAVLGEQTFGAGRGVANLFYVTLSTGLGGGAMVDGHLLNGKDGNAPEIGHVTIDPDSELLCGCGCRGHWEAYCSGANIPNLARLLLRGRSLEGSLLHEAVGGDMSGLTSEAIFSAASRGDPMAAEIVGEVGRVNAVGFGDIVNAFDPELVTVGGSVALNNPDLILGPIMAGIDRHLINRKPEIRITPLGEDIVLHGALALAIRAKRRDSAPDILPGPGLFRRPP